MSEPTVTRDEILDEVFSIGNITDEQYRAVKRLRGEVQRLSGERDALRGVAAAARLLFGWRGTTPSAIHHPNCQIYGATVIGLACDCGSELIRTALGALADFEAGRIIA